MIKPEQIPRAVIDVMMEPITYPAGATVETIYEIRMAAALSAWPNTLTTTTDDAMLVCRPALILPLTKEAADEPQKTDRRYNVAERLFGDD